MGGGGGGGGGWGGGGVISYIFVIVQMCVLNGPFFSAANYMIGPLFFNKKYMHGLIFQDSYGKGSIFLTSWYIHIFFAQKFFGAACSLGIQ